MFLDMVFRRICSTVFMVIKVTLIDLDPLDLASLEDRYDASLLPVIRNLR